MIVFETKKANIPNNWDLMKEDEKNKLISKLGSKGILHNHVPNKHKGDLFVVSDNNTVQDYINFTKAVCDFIKNDDNEKIYAFAEELTDALIYGYDKNSDYYNNFKKYIEDSNLFEMEQHRYFYTLKENVKKKDVVNFILKLKS